METVISRARQVGNSSGVLLPRGWLNKRVVVTLAEPDEKDILHSVLEILYTEGILKNVLGIYLIGSHARGRGESTAESDIDLLVITDNINRTIDKDNYQINLIGKSMLLKSLKEMPFHYFPMIYEARPLLNQELLALYKKLKINLKSSFIKDTKKALKESKEIISLDKRLGSNKTGDAVAYSLILRLRGLYILDRISKKQLWVKKEFEDLIKKITGNLDVYKRYLHAKGKGGSKDNSIYIKDAEKIINYLEKEMLKWENMKKDRE